ncbi:MAG TPA: UDP-N-acetylenolpyruvoylglucosamine reductase [Deltaproteobacteria bacterium]|nr:UDP-N-acetylenolpyruvoylglucosamine reductase [Deltaproteobacteria bacterium]
MDPALLESLLQERLPQAPASGWQEKLKTLVEGELRFDEPLKRHTTLQVGGPADAFVYPAHLEDLKKIVAFAQENHVPWIVLGWGSNILVKDGGIRGIVLRLQKNFTRFQILEESESQVRCEAEAGVPLPKVVEAGRQNGWKKIEVLYGIPGSVGGTLRMNAGTRAGEIQEFVEEITVLRPDGSLFSYPRKKIKFEYRSSNLPAREIIVSGKFRFEKAPVAEVQEAVAVYQKKRHDSQPLEFPNVGSVFKNPDKAFAAQIIDELGLKGIRVGGARISEKHANFIVNENQATARDVLVLIGLIRDKAREELDLKLELEVKVLGEDDTV